MDNDHLCPPGQHAARSASPPSIELADMSSSEAVSSESSMSVSDTPLSTPGTSVRPSFNSSENPSTSRPTSSGRDTAHPVPDNDAQDDDRTHDLGPNSQGEMSQPSHGATESNISSTSSSLSQTARFNLSNWGSTSWSRLSKWDSFQTFIGLVVSILAVITFVFSYRSYEIAKWQSWHDFRDDCTSSDNRRKGKACQAFLSQPLVEPPFQKGSGITRLAARALKPAVTLSQQGQLGKYFNFILGLMLAFLGLRLLQNFRKATNAEETQTRSHHQPPWNLIPLSWLRRNRDSSTTSDWTSAPVRDQGPISISTQTDEGQDRTRRRFIPPRPETVLNDLPTPSDPDTRKKTFQDHLNDLWVNPPWRRNGSLPTLTGDERTSISISDNSLRRGSDEESRITSPSHTSESNQSQLTTHSSLRSRVRRRIPRHDSSSSSDSDSNSTTTVGKNLARKTSVPSESYNRGTRLRIKSGAAALGMAESGAAIAAMVGGEAGQEILVHGTSARDVKTPLPQSPQDVSMIP